MKNRVFKIIAISLFTLTLFCVNGLCDDVGDIGLTFKTGKYDRVGIFYGDKKKELLVKDEYFLTPKMFTKSAEGDYILFVDFIEGNKYDTNLYIYDIKKNTTGMITLRNVKLEFVHKMEWFDTHSFIIDIQARDILNYTLGNYGPLQNGNYLIKFNDKYEIEKLKKIDW